jgi:hypothetical protein
VIFQSFIIFISFILFSDTPPPSNFSENLDVKRTLLIVLYILVLGGNFFLINLDINKYKNIILMKKLILIYTIVTTMVYIDDFNYSYMLSFKAKEK